jgi:nucleoside-diphosphate-sugar epimerase
LLGPLRWLFLDLVDAELDIPTGVDTLVHAAGEKSDTARMFAVNHEGTRRLVDTAARAGVRRFVYISSVGVYGAAAHSGLVDETSSKRPRNTYEASKAAGEDCVRELCQRAGMEYVILQPSNVVAALDTDSVPLLAFLSGIKRGRFVWFGDGDGWVNYVAVEDVAAGVVEAALYGPSDRTFILNTPHRLDEVVRWSAELLGVPVPCRRLPLWVGRVAATTGDLLAGLGRSLPIDSNRFLEMTNTTRFDGSRLHQATGFDYPLGMQAMLSRLVDRYAREGRL